MGQKERNKATEVVDGVVETVDVSKHPTASIEPSDLSLADIERRKSHPVRWILFMALVLLAMIAPYWWGRDIAVRDASWMVANLNFLDPKGVALISWTVTIVALTGLGLMVADAKKWLWGTIFVSGLAAEQFAAGMCLLSFNFWNATYVMYGEAAGLANAAAVSGRAAVSDIFAALQPQDGDTIICKVICRSASDDAAANDNDFSIHFVSSLSLASTFISMGRMGALPVAGPSSFGRTHSSRATMPFTSFVQVCPWQRPIPVRR